MVIKNVLAVALTYLTVAAAAPSAGNKNVVIAYLRPVLKYTGGAARLYYAAACPVGESDFLFPTIDLQTPTKGATGVPAVQQFFRKDPRVKVTRDRSGMLRITIGSVATALLQTRIPTLTLNSTDRYNPAAAVLGIERTPEFYLAENRLDMFEPPHGIVEIVRMGPTAGAPGLPEVMHNVTADQALDIVARTFKGIVEYGTCKDRSGKRFFVLSFIVGS